MPEGTKSLPCWPCRAAAAAAVWTGMATPLGARPPLGQRGGRSLPSRRPRPVGGAGARATCPPPSWWSWGRVVVAPAGGAAAAVARGCSGPLKCGRIRRGATLGVAVRRGGAAEGSPAAARALLGPPFRQGGRGETIPALHPPPLVGARGALQPPHPAAPPYPPRWRGVSGGPVSGLSPPLVAGATGGPWPPRPIRGVITPPEPPD